MAGIQLDLTVQTQALRRELAALQSDIADRVVVQALNRAITGVRADAVRALRETFTLPASALRKRMNIRRATRATLSAAIFLRRDFDPPLYLFKPRWRQRQPVGATVQLGKGGGRQSVPGAFVARTRYGRDAVFKREGPGRTPLVFLRASDIGGPTIAKALLERAAQQSLRQSGRTRFVNEARRLAARRLSVSGGAFGRLRVD